MKKIKAILLVSVLTFTLFFATGCGLFNDDDGFIGVTNVVNDYEMQNIFLEVGEEIEFDYHKQFENSVTDITRVDAQCYNEDVAVTNGNKITAKSAGRTTVSVDIYSKKKDMHYLTNALNVFVTDREHMTQIKTAEDLANIALDLSGNYILADDIDLANYGDWQSIPSFTGILVNPDGYIIKNLTNVDSSRQSRGYGLFYSLDYGALVHGIILEDVFIDSRLGTYVGGITAYNFVSLIQDCSVSGTVISNGDTGGIVGYNDRGNIYNCNFSGNVKTTNNSGAGGIAGYVYPEAIISNCTVNATVESLLAAGGIVGFSRYELNCTGNSFKGELLSAKHKDDVIGYIGYPWDALNEV